MSESFLLACSSIRLPEVAVGLADVRLHCRPIAASRAINLTVALRSGSLNALAWAAGAAGDSHGPCDTEVNGPPMACGMGQWPCAQTLSPVSYTMLRVILRAAWPVSRIATAAAAPEDQV